MDYHMICDAIDVQIKTLQDLLKRLSQDGGRKMTSDERRLIRTCFLPHLDEVFTMLRIQFLTGEMEFGEHEQDRLIDLFTI